MGGGTMLPAVSGLGGGPYGLATIIKPTATTTDLHAPLSSSLSSVSIKPSSGISCVCHENVDSSLDGSECKAVSKCSSGCIFGPVPSRIEVENAMADLQRFLNGEAKSDFHWLQPIVYPSGSRMLQRPGYGRIHDAFSMLQKEPSLQNMVVSMSSDKAVWNAILSNRAVQDLRGSISAEERMQTSTEEADIANLIIKWIMGITKSKIAAMIEKIGQLMAELFLPSDKEKPTSELTDLVEEKIRSSLFLTVIILLIVVVTRNHAA